MEYLIFNKPKTNIQRAFGLFAQLEKMGFSRGTLNPIEQFIVINISRKTYYSSPKETDSQDIPSDYTTLINKKMLITFEK